VRTVIDPGPIPDIEITIATDGGPWALHNMPCYVCDDEPAILNLSNGIFEPGAKCKAAGWQLKKKRKFIKSTPPTKCRSCDNMAMKREEYCSDCMDLLTSGWAF
jgi:hypothetical protein